MAPALRMTRSIKEKLKIFIFVFLDIFTVTKALFQILAKETRN